MTARKSQLIPADPKVLEHAPVAACACCGARLPGGDDGCRAAFGEVLAREYSDPAYGAVHLLTVDAHALQHSDWHSRRSNAAHLVRLCWLIERGGDAAIGVRGPLEHAAKSTLGDWPFLEPPQAPGAMTVADLHAAKDVAAHCAIAREWGRAVWLAWSEHHDWARKRLDALSART
jgi:hypothetical protein